MTKLLAYLLSPTGLLYIFVAIGQFAQAVYVATGELEPHPTFSFLYAIGFLWIITWWLFKDNRKRGISRVYDMGLFLYIAWPFFMPYYLVTTRGARGLLVILGFLVVYLGAGILGFLTYLALFSNAAWPQ